MDTEHEVETLKKYVEAAALNPVKRRTPPIVRGEPKVYRNQPCTCGSGLKSKRCCYK